MNPLLPFIVTISTWLTPSPTYATGLVVQYDSQYVVEANASYRGYDLSPYYKRCGGSLMSPSDLGKMFWVLSPNDVWIPCLSVDAGARRDYSDLLRKREIAELPDWLMVELGTWYSIETEIYIGLCPPSRLPNQPKPYSPPVELTDDYRQPYIPYPPQQLPHQYCDKPIPLHHNYRRH